MNAAERALQGWTADQWCKGRFYDHQGRSCLWGRLIEDSVDGVVAALVAVGEIVQEQYALDGVVAFNDAPETTFADVVAVLEKAAVRLNEAV